MIFFHFESIFYCSSLYSTGKRLCMTVICKYGNKFAQLFIRIVAAKKGANGSLWFEALNVFLFFSNIKGMC